MSLLWLGQNGYDVHMGHLLKLGRNPKTHVSYGGKKPPHTSILVSPKSSKKLMKKN